uniref:transcriptional regulator ATRX homolog n=1 Tax=Doryrhamphus excisus TaxID=161450 RepID=UPI0025AE99F6|nr:transcriptional regulator ATRX homolog [Doryrhamphus excisus]XP_057943282.1 transcriptional regulator ATRX homolog [Doryrhamphus excisus]XP_057943283.1 transcriptional regulator ATRX homolog [Doryrhamphus excisus]
MSQVPNNLGWIQPDILADAISAESCHIVLEKSPPDYVKKISEYLDCSHNPVSDDGPTERDSDSGDSLFLTQKPVPKPVRTIRRPKSSQHVFCTELEDSGGDSSSSHGDDAQKTSKKKKKFKSELPKYNFPFLQERKRKSTLKNIKLNNYVTGGFFKCVQLWQDASNSHAALPTVDQDGEDILPLTEDEEDEKFGDEDIKVVERKCFLVKSKTQSPLLWYTPRPCTQKGKHQQENGAAFKRSQSSEKMSAGLSLTKEETSAGASSTGNNELKQTQTAKESGCLSRISKRILFPDKSELCDATNFAGNEPVRQEESQVDTLSNEQALRERQHPLSEMNDVNNAGDEEEGADLLSRQGDGGHVNTSALPARHKAALHENNEMEKLSEDAGDFTSIKQKRKKRRKKIQEEQDANSHDLSLKDASVLAVAVESGEHKSKKRKKSKREAEEKDGVEDFSSCTASETQSSERPRKKKKKQSHETSAESLDVTAASAKRKKKKRRRDSTQEDDTSEKPCSDDAPFIGGVKKKKKKKKKEVSPCASDEACLLNSPDQTQNVADKTHEMTQHKDAEPLTKKKKKKKKKKSSRHISEECD